MEKININKEFFLRDLNKVREIKPLVHNITNYVVMNNTANALLAVGASPVMAHSVEEVEEMAGIASSLVLNIGTLEPQWIEAMIKAGKVAKSKGIPVVFDPVGAGATSYRTRSCVEILNEVHPEIIRGNASEIVALAAANQVKTRGVDSTLASEDAIEFAAAFAKENNLVVSISGAVDYITDGSKIYQVTNGSEKLVQVTGLGCTATAITGSFAAVNPNRLEAAAHAMLLMGCAGEKAASYSKGNGSLQLNFLDELCNFDETLLNELTDGRF